jgi:hypothetical protein
MGTLHLYIGGVLAILLQTFGKQQSKEVIARLNALCKVKEEKKFEARLKKLEKILMMMQRLGCWSNDHRNLNGLLLLTWMVLDMG